MSMSVSRWGALFLLALAPAAGASGCGMFAETCEHTATCDVGDSCPGECVPLPPLDFNGPALLWIGPEVDAPECPDRAPVQVYEGHAGLDDSNQCPACECTAPACVLPSGLSTSTAGGCPQGAGGVQTSLDAPPDWTGACAPAPAAVSNVRSISLEAVAEQPCEPVPSQVPSDFGSPWSSFARACIGEAISNVCGDPGMTCLPTAEPPPPGFRQCILYLGAGEPECPADYHEKHAFYGGVDDTRECAPCECTQTVASECSARLTVYQDQACTAALNTFMNLDLGGTPPCIDLGMPAVQYGSMDAAWSVNQPGQCVASGGVPLGEVKPVNAKTFCCQPGGDG